MVVLSLEQQSAVSQEESPRGTGEVQQHHQYPVHCHPPEGMNPQFEGYGPIMELSHLHTKQNSSLKTREVCAVLCLLLILKAGLTGLLQSCFTNIMNMWQEMSHKDLQTIENIKWDPPYDPASGWKKSSINVKNYGRMIHSSKVRFRFLHCQVSGTKLFHGFMLKYQHL